jgi:hypothetical protein
MNKYEQLIEYIINEQDAKARELFHQIVVEKSREIYENLIDEEDVEESIVDPVGNLVDEVEAEDEMGMAEADDEMDDMGGEMDADMEMPADDMGGDDMGGEMGDEMGGEDNIEDRVMDLEAALDELKAEFDALMSDEMDEPEHADMEMPGNDMGDDMGEPKEAMVREYVDKVQRPPVDSEGHEVGAGGSQPINAKSITDNMKNDMGGSNANIVKGGTEQAADGKPTPKPNNAYSKGQTEHELAKRNVNVPGGNKGAQDWYNKKNTSYEKAKGKEGQTTSGSMGVDKKSLVGSKG